jgi:hypothetical protein
MTSRQLNSSAWEMGTFPADSIKARRPSYLQLKAGYKTATATSITDTRKPNLANGEVFICALQRPSLTRVLVAAALDQCGWVLTTTVDVVTDGARGMRSLVTSVAPCVAPRILDWYHIGMKLHSVRSALCAYTLPLLQRPVVMQRCKRLLSRVRDKLWHGRGDAAIEMYARSSLR